MSCPTLLLSIPVALLLLAADVASVNPPRLTTIPPENRDICSRNMACGWAVCAWTQNVYNPDRDKCIFITNAGCRCLKNYSCHIDLTSIEPTIYRQPFVQYEYQCRMKNNSDEKRALKRELDDGDKKK